MTHSVHKLCTSFDHLVVDVLLDNAVCSRDDLASANCQFAQISDVTNFSSDSLVFVSNAAALDSQINPAVIVTSRALSSELGTRARCVLVVKDVRLAQATIKQAYADYDARDMEWDVIHSSAVIHPTAKLADDVRVGPNSVIGAHTQIGAGTTIRANCVIEHDAVVGEDCIINNLVNIGQGCILGNRVIVRPGVIIGNEGFGFAADENRRYERVPHTGIVVIGDDVQIGSNCNIDRATYGQTVIKRGVKIDALCHIAHNCVVDEDALFVAQCGVAGSSNIGKRVICSGQTGVLDHKTIADDAVLLHRCGVTEDIPTGGKWAGTPAKPLKEYVSNLNAAKRLERKLAKLQAEVAQLKSSN